MFTSIQIVLIIFILFAISRVYLRAKERVIPVKTAAFWAFIWITALIGIALPTTTSKIAAYVGVGRGVDVIVYISLALLFYLVFRIYVMIEDLRHEITKLISNIGLKNTQKKSTSKKPIK